MLRFSLLGSGSGGNALLVATDRGQVLVDNGLSFKRLAERCAAVDMDLTKTQAIFVTHEHGDHVLGVGTLARRLGIPVYITPGTYHALPPKIGPLPEVRFFEAGDSLRHEDIALHSFSVSHDAADPVSFTVCSDGGARLGIATDLGHVSHLVRNRLSGVHALVLESNYCPDMLLNGEYPATVQARIRSRIGHLSNQLCASLLSQIAHAALRTVVLIHISEKNNTAEKARAIAAQALAGYTPELLLACQDKPTPLIPVAVP